MKKNSVAAVILAFLIPGAGHFYLDRRARGIAFFLIVIIMLVLGLWLDGKLYVIESGKPLTILATLGSMGAGIPYFIARFTGPFGDMASATYEYGTAFTLTAGLMNLLLMLDCYDIAEGRKS